MLSVGCTDSNRILLPGILFALYSSTYKIGFPGWPEPILDSVTGFGASITKRGLAPAPFFISQLIFSFHSMEHTPNAIGGALEHDAPTARLLAGDNA